MMFDLLFISVSSIEAGGTEKKTSQKFVKKAGCSMNDKAFHSSAVRLWVCYL